MQKVSHKYVSASKLTAVLVVAILATGCIGAESKLTEEETVAEPAPAPKAVEKVVETEAVEPDDELGVWSVVTGNALWGITEVEEVYNVPEHWPLIYKANRDQIITAAEPAPAPKAVEKVVETEAVEPDDELGVWSVVTGNSLWGISEVDEVYNVPEHWPLIYKANRDQIIDADLIYPGQVLTIPRDIRQNEIDAAIP